MVIDIVRTDVDSPRRYTLIVRLVKDSAAQEVQQ
jgi:hypothetical protein